MLNLAELKERVDAAIESAIEYGAIAEDIKISIQIESPSSSIWSSDVDLHYDNDLTASGCVLVGEREEEEKELHWHLVSDRTPPHGIPIWLWSKEWIDEDFNPTGVRDGHHIEGEGYVSCGWDPCGDVFTTDEKSVPQQWAFRIPPSC